MAAVEKSGVVAPPDMEPGPNGRLNYEDLATLAGYIGAFYCEEDKAVRREHPLLPEETLLLESALDFIVSCVPSEHHLIPKAKGWSVRLSRSAALTLLEGESASLYDNDDLRQEAFLAAIKALRSYDQVVRHHVIGAIGVRIAAHFKAINQRAYLGGLSARSSRGVPIATGQSLEQLLSIAIANRTEFGWSEELEEVQAHPDYYTKVEFESSGAEEVPEPAMEFGFTLDRLLKAAGELGVELTEKEELGLRLYYEKGMTQQQIAKARSPQVTRQVVSMQINSAIGKLRRCGVKLERSLD